MRSKLMVVFTILALSLSACAQAAPNPLPSEPAASEVPALETPQAPPQESPQTTPTLPVLQPENPDNPVISPGKPGEEDSPANPWDPQPGDKNLERGGVFIDAKSLVTMESFPPQYVLSIEGNLPTPCNMLRVKVGEPDEQGQIKIEAYSVIDNTMACIQVLSPFIVNVPLGSFTDVTYTVLLNDEVVGEIGK